MEASASARLHRCIQLLLAVVIPVLTLVLQLPLGDGAGVVEEEAVAKLLGKGGGGHHPCAVRYPQLLDVHLLESGNRFRQLLSIQKAQVGTPSTAKILSSPDTFRAWFR